MDNAILQYIKDKFKNSSDIIYRELISDNGSFTITYFKNITETNSVSQLIIKPIRKAESKVRDLQELMDKIILVTETEMILIAEDAVSKLLAGHTIITCNFDKRALACNMANFASRNIPKPDTDPVIKGPQEGFSEYLKDNLSLIRKRIRNENLVVDTINMGTNSQTPVTILYIKNTAPKKLVNTVISKIKNIKIDFILETNYIEEEFKDKYTLFDTVGNYDKPDIICSKLFEGRIAILVEGSSTAAVIPHFFSENFTAPDDYYTNRFVVTGLRIFRYFSFFLSVLLPGFYIALTTYHHSLIPSVFLFKLAATRAGVPFPSILELLLMFLFLELSREAGKRLPRSIGSTLTLVSTLILGETATSAGLASGGTIVIVGVYAVTSLINPKLVGPIVALTLIDIALSAIFGLHGFFIFFVMMISHLASLDSCGYPYLFPLGTSEQIMYKTSDFFLRGELKDISYNVLKGTDDE